MDTKQMFEPRDPWVTFVTDVVSDIRGQPNFAFLPHKSEVEKMYTTLMVSLKQHLCHIVTRCFTR